MPNVIYVFPDQMRNSALGFWSEDGYCDSVNFLGDPVVTPSLDNFAHESLVLTSAMSNCPVSSPHRGMLLTGMFTENSGVPMNCNSNRPNSSLARNTVCISDVLKKCGYSCGYIGKLHVECPTRNDPDRKGMYVEDRIPAWDAYTAPEDRHGFDYWYSYGTFDIHKRPHYWNTKGEKIIVNEWSPIHESNKAIEFLRNEKGERDASKPFFLMVGFNPPHSPYSSVDDCMVEDFKLYANQPLDSLLVRPNADLTMKKAESVRFYFASITGVDRAFGKILAELKKLHLEQNTIVVFSSDHGETMCSHSLEDPKNSPYVESMNVPFIIRYPGKINPGIDRRLILSTPDIMPTLLGLCGLENEIPKTVEGRNYSGYLIGKDSSIPLRTGALYQKNVDGDKDVNGKAYCYFPISRGIKTERYTLSLSIDKKNKTLKDVFLFDDLIDPYQMCNLGLKGNESLVKRLCEQMVPLLEEADDPWYKERILSDLIPYNK